MSEALVDLDAPPIARDTGGRSTADGLPGTPVVERLQLRWHAADGAPSGRPLEGGVTSLGAHPANDVVLEDRYVSGFHCRLHLREGRWRVRDLGSTNGTFVDGLRVSEAELLPGARLRLGRQDLWVDVEGERSRHEGLPGFLSRQPALEPVLDLLRRAAPSSLPVMILGESGTGKEVAARAVHDLSRRASGPFVPLNCGAISHEIAEAELFGHEKGSFTGAVGSAPGAFGAADGGTLFLDEIGDLPPPLQVKLLRALEAGEVKPVGAARPRRIDVRVICATHHDLRGCVRDGTFREDLYYRLRGVTVELPPLRDRPLDILPLAEHFLALEEGRRMFSTDARQALLAHRWPGNVRELKQAVQLASLLSEGNVIRASALQFDGSPRSPVGRAVSVASEPDLSIDTVDLRGRTLADVEERAIRAAHVRHGGNRRAMAKELGIARSSLLRKLDLLGLRTPGHAVPGQ